MTDDKDALPSDQEDGSLKPRSGKEPTKPTKQDVGKPGERVDDESGSGEKTIKRQE